MRPTMVYLSPATHRVLEDLAEAQGKKVSTVVREFLEEATETRKRDLAGTSVTGPATNNATL